MGLTLSVSQENAAFINKRELGKPGKDRITNIIWQKRQFKDHVFLAAVGGANVIIDFVFKLKSFIQMLCQCYLIEVFLSKDVSKLDDG